MGNGIFAGLGPLLVQVCLAAFIVFMAMCVDLASGLYKARVRGEVHSSWGLKRSVQKFILYEGAILIAGGIDILFLTCRVMAVAGCTLLHGVAVFTGFIAVLLCIVEIWSLREKADEKTRKDINRAGELINSLIDRKQLAAAVGKAVAANLAHLRSTQCEDGGVAAGAPHNTSNLGISNLGHQASAQ